MAGSTAIQTVSLWFDHTQGSSVARRHSFSVANQAVSRPNETPGTYKDTLYIRPPFCDQNSCNFLLCVLYPCINCTSKKNMFIQSSVSLALAITAVTATGKHKHKGSYGGGGMMPHPMGYPGIIPMPGGNSCPPCPYQQFPIGMPGMQPKKSHGHGYKRGGFFGGKHSHGGKGYPGGGIMQYPMGYPGMNPACPPCQLPFPPSLIYGIPMPCGQYGVCYKPPAPVIIPPTCPAGSTCPTVPGCIAGQPCSNPIPCCPAGQRCPPPYPPYVPPYTPPPSTRTIIIPRKTLQLASIDGFQSIHIIVFSPTWNNDCDNSSTRSHNLHSSYVFVVPRAFLRFEANRLHR